MTRRLVLLSLILLALSTGCVVPCLQPLYTPETLTFEDTLIGTWQLPDDGGSYTFGDNNDGGYLVFQAGGNDNPAGVFNCHLVRLEDRLFLDMYPDLGEQGVPGFAPWHYAPLHSVYLIEQIRPTLKLRTLNPDWLMSSIEQDPQLVGYSMIDLYEGDSLPVLTGSTAELQAFYESLADSPDAFYDEIELTPMENLTGAPVGAGMAQEPKQE